MLFKDQRGNLQGQFRDVNLFTDASHNCRLQTLGGAWWAIFDGRRIQRQSRRREVKGSAEAEVRVACGAIHKLLEHPDFLEWRRLSLVPVRLTLVVDCLAIHDAFTGHSPVLAKLARPTRKLLKAEGITLKLSHVKAHKGTSSPRNWVNNWCDRMARAARKTLERFPA